MTRYLPTKRPTFEDALQQADDFEDGVVTYQIEPRIIQQGRSHNQASEPSVKKRIVLANDAAPASQQELSYAPCFAYEVPPLICDDAAAPVNGELDVTDRALEVQQLLAAALASRDAGESDVVGNCGADCRSLQEQQPQQQPQQPQRLHNVTNHPAHLHLHPAQQQQQQATDSPAGTPLHDCPQHHIQESQHFVCDNTSTPAAAVTSSPPTSSFAFDAPAPGLACTPAHTQRASATPQTSVTPRDNHFQQPAPSDEGPSAKQVKPPPWHAILTPAARGAATPRTAIAKKAPAKKTSLFGKSGGRVPFSASCGGLSGMAVAGGMSSQRNPAELMSAMSARVTHDVQQLLAGSSTAHKTGSMAATSRVVPRGAAAGPALAMPGGHHTPSRTPAATGNNLLGSVDRPATSAPRLSFQQQLQLSTGLPGSSCGLPPPSSPAFAPRRLTDPPVAVPISSTSAAAGGGRPMAMSAAAFTSRSVPDLLAAASLSPSASGTRVAVDTARDAQHDGHACHGPVATAATNGVVLHRSGGAAASDTLALLSHQNAAQRQFLAQLPALPPAEAGHAGASRHNDHHLGHGVLVKRLQRINMAHKIALEQAPATTGTAGVLQLTVLQRVRQAHLITCLCSCASSPGGHTTAAVLVDAGQEARDGLDLCVGKTFHCHAPWGQLLLPAGHGQDSARHAHDSAAVRPQGPPWATIPATELSAKPAGTHAGLLVICAYHVKPASGQ